DWDGTNLTVNANTTFDHNTAWNFGGAIDNRGTMNITGASFTNNHALYGGAVLNGGGTNIASPIVTSSPFDHNTATYFGGAIWNEQSGITLSGCGISFNSAGFGGGIVNDGGELNVLFGTQIKLNTATSSLGGGGIYTWHAGKTNFFSSAVTD